MDSSLSSIPLAPPPPIPPPPVAPITPIVSNQTTTVAASLPPSYNHPPYSDMICEAIVALKEMNGSSKKAIEKYIESAHKDLPPTHAALLGHHLKTLKNNGVLVMVKNSYKLASTIVRSEDPDISPEPKRGRGRPPKPKTVVPAADASSGQQLVPLSDVSKRSPGRPRKNGPAAQLGNILKVRGRGRPPKSGLKRSPGRPKKPKTVRSVVGANAMKRGRGRPSKASNQLAPVSKAAIPRNAQPVAVPYADSDAPTSAATVGVPRPRGRPKGKTPAAAPVMVHGKPRGRPPKFGGVHGKPRGRPPKFSGFAAKHIEPTGRPVGRPKKATDGAELKALAAANGHLKEILEFFQVRVKQAVEALKPQLTSESNRGAIGAILELEGLVAMQISTPPTEIDAQLPSSPPPPPPLAQPPVAQNEGQVL